MSDILNIISIIVSIVSIFLSTSCAIKINKFIKNNNINQSKSIVSGDQIGRDKNA